jgi:hypothetical protein
MGVVQSWRTKAGIRTRLSWRKRLIVLGCVLSAYGVLSAVRRLPWWVDVLAAVVGVAVSLYEIARARQARRAVYFAKRVGESFDHVVDVQTGNARLITSDSGDGILFLAESAGLRRRPAVVRVSKETFRQRVDLSEWSLDFLAEETRQARVFNGDVVGVYSWTVDDSTGALSVGLRPCGYHDFIATNVMSQYDVKIGMTTVQKGQRLYIDRFGRLRSFEQSGLANIVGISTLAFSADGQLLIVQQTAKNVGSRSLRAPSGSGALEGRDVVEVGENTTLQDVIVRGAERELIEECNLEPGWINDSKAVIGCGRWLTRGAMPEFSAVSLVDKDASELVRRTIRKGEKHFVQGVEAIRLTPRHRWNADDPESMLPADERWGLSFPLLLALSALADAIDDPDSTTMALLRERLEEDALERPG